MNAPAQNHHLSSVDMKTDLMVAATEPQTTVNIGTAAAELSISMGCPASRFGRALVFGVSQTHATHIGQFGLADLTPIFFYLGLEYS